MVCPFGIGRKIGRKKIGEEKQLQNRKNNKQLDQDQLPQGSTNNHGTESVVIHGINFFDRDHSNIPARATVIDNNFGINYTSQTDCQEEL